jgi:hypothetical protein
MIKFQTVSLCLLLIGLGMAACRTELPPPSPTAEVASLLTDPQQVTAEAEGVVPTFTSTVTPRPTATNTRVPTTTPVPTPTPTSTPKPLLIQVDETLTVPINIRGGPGTDYPVLVQFAPGQQAEALGRNEADTWWQISLADTKATEPNGWVFGELVNLSGDDGGLPVVEAPPLPATSTPGPAAIATAVAEADEANNEDDDVDEPLPSAVELAEQLDCGKDFCVTYQAMLPIWENGGCIGNHSIYITVLQGLPPGEPMDGVVIGDTFNNVEVGSGDKGPGRTEITLWNNSMTLIAKRNVDGTPYTSEESFNFTASDELIPAEVLAANGYCDGNVETCRWAQQHNQVCRGHYSWRVTFHKFD